MTREALSQTALVAPSPLFAAEPRVTLDVDLGRVRANFGRIAAKVHPLKVIAVLKANAYGLGVHPIARCLLDAGAHGFGVAELREALAIKDLGLPVQILGGVLPEEVPPLVAAGIVAPITDAAIAECLSEEARRQNRVVECHFIVDTGMGRVGIRREEAAALIPRLGALPGLLCTGIYSHFPHAYGDAEFSARQVTEFIDLLEELRRQGIEFQWVHMANSDGINNLPASCQAPFNLVRTGINLYGVFDLVGQHELELEAALSLRAKLVAARELPAGATIGYGCTCVLEQPTRVGTIPIGYADGLPLAMSSCGEVLIRGQRCRILGRVSMDYTTVSLESVPEAVVGDEVVCLGDGITVSDWARYKGTIPYEIICAIGNRVARRYVES